MQTIQIVVVDRHDLSRYGISTLVSKSNPSLQIIAMFNELKQAEQYLCEHRIHVLLIDDQLPQTPDIENVIGRLHDQYVGMGIIVLGNKLNPRYVTRLLDQGARGFVYKQDNLEDTLVPAIKTVRGGSLYLSPRAAALFYTKRQIQREDGLNSSDLAVLQLVEQGYNPQEIAGQLDLSPRTVYRIYGRLRQALNVRTNEQIIDSARKRGLLDDISP